MIKNKKKNEMKQKRDLVVKKKKEPLRKGEK